jgi:hypothetical protein
MTDWLGVNDPEIPLCFSCIVLASSTLNLSGLSVQRPGSKAPPFFFMSLFIYSFVPHYAPIRVPGLELERFYAVADRRYLPLSLGWHPSQNSVTISSPSDFTFSTEQATDNVIPHSSRTPQQVTPRLRCGLPLMPDRRVFRHMHCAYGYSHWA